MMHMWMWFGYDVGEFLFSGAVVSTRVSFAFTWIALFIVSVLFEWSKVYLLQLQRFAHRKMSYHKSIEGRSLTCRSGIEQTTSHGSTTYSRWAVFKTKLTMNILQTLVFLVHNVVGYLLMLAVMIYNVQLIAAVVLGLMLGYFLFGPMLLNLQLQCHNARRTVICTPECDEHAENSSTPPLLNASLSSESDLFICQTRSCLQPSHYFRARPSTSDGDVEGDAGPSTSSCHYGANQCPSKVARVRRHRPAPGHCHHDADKDEPTVEDIQLLHDERHSHCKKEPPPEAKTSCCKKSSQVEATVEVHASVVGGGACSGGSEAGGTCGSRSDAVGACGGAGSEAGGGAGCRAGSEAGGGAERRGMGTCREDSPQISCCHHPKSVSTDSQEQIIQ